MEKDFCEKCENYGWVEKHHVLPKCEFGDDGELVKLCPNCHTDYHQKLGRKNLKNKSMVFHFEKFYRWLAGLSIILIIFVMIFNFI